MEFLSISVITVLSILSLIAARKFLQKAVELLRSTKMLKPRQNPIAVSLHREVAEMRRTTQQISKDWGSMVNLMTSVKDQQSISKDILKDEIRCMSEILQDTVIMSLEEEYLRSDQRFSKITKMVNIFRDDLTVMKEMIANQGDLLLTNFQKLQHSNNNVEHMWTQTECEVVIRKKGKIEGETIENDATKPMVGIRRILSEFQKETKKNASREREEIMSYVDTILSRLSADRENIKNAIQKAFLVCSYKNQKSFEEFGSVGQEALKYIAEKSEKANMQVRDKLQEFDKKLKHFFELIQATTFDVSIIKSTLDNMDSQLDDIFQRVELGCQKNVEHCEDVLNSLETATEVWTESSSKLGDLAEQLEVLTSGAKHLMTDMNENKDESKKMALSKTKDGSEAQDQVLAIISAHQDDILLAEYNMNTSGLVQLQNMAEECSKNIKSLNDQLENGTKETALAMENLLRQILFVCDLVKNVGDRFQLIEPKLLKNNDVIINQSKEFVEDECMKSELNAHKLKPIEGATNVSNVKGNDCKLTGYSNLRSPKKVKPAMKLKNASSPTKKGKSIYSDTSPPDIYGKSRERNNVIGRNKV